MIPKYLWFLILSMLGQTCLCQNFEPDKISMAELEEKAHPKDTAAVAAYLINHKSTTFAAIGQYPIRHRFHVRIKIYKKEGLSYANYEIPYFGGGKADIESVSIIKATTYNLVDGKIVATPLSEEGKHKESVDKRWKTITITMPAVKEGSVIDFEYSIKSVNVVYFPRFYFQKEIPVNFSEYYTAIPNWFMYKPVVKGFIDVDTKISNEKSNFLGEQTLMLHTASNIPALKPEEFVDNPENYFSSIMYEIEAVKQPGKPARNFAQTWEGLVKNIFEDDAFGKQLKSKNYFDKELKEVIKGIDSIDKKINVIFDFVKNRMNWDGELGIFTEKGVKESFRTKTGNVAEINFILIAMLNASGIESYPVISSTVQNGVAAFPSRTAFNYVVASVRNKGKNVLLDATDKNAMPAILPLHALNWNGRLIRKDGTSEEISMVPDFLSKNNSIIMGTLDETGRLSGKARIQRSEHEAMIFRQIYSIMNEDQYNEYMEHAFENIAISNYSVENVKNFSEPVMENFDFSSEKLSGIIGKNIYISPFLFFGQPKNPFTHEERQLPIYFGYPKQTRYTIILKIPEGYMVESMPKPCSITISEDMASFRYNISCTQDQIQIAYTSEIKKMLLPAPSYPAIKDFFQKMTEKQNEKIILKKINP